MSVSPKVGGGEEDPVLRQQVQLANQLSLLQQLTTTGQGSDAKSSASSSDGGAAISSSSQVSEASHTLSCTALSSGRGH